MYDWVSGSIELSKDPDGYAVTILWSIEGQRIAEKVEIVRAGDLPDQIVLDHEFSNSDWGSYAFFSLAKRGDDSYSAAVRLHSFWKSGGYINYNTRFGFVDVDYTGLIMERNE